MSPEKKSAHNNSPINPDALARGCAYALEQAWHLLEDAVLLIQNKRYASSLVLATFCLEQLGRADIYRENAVDAQRGKKVTLGSMERELKHHLPKLYRAQIPVTATVGFFAGSPPEPGSDEERKLARHLEAIRGILEEQAPHKALADRARSIHVDRVHRMPGWTRPCQEIERSDADYYVGAARVRYGLLRDHLRRDDTAVGKAIRAWIQKLQLPEAPWDVWTWEEEVSESKQAANR